MITLNELKTYLIITDNSKDDQLNQAILNAVGFLEGYLMYSLELDTGKVAVFIGYCNAFELKEININAVSEIKTGEDEFDETLTTYTGKKKVYNEKGLIKTQENIGPYTEIVYSFGYDEITCPQDLKTALLEIASAYYKSTGEISLRDVKSESVDGDTISFNDVRGKISERSITILDKYKTYEFSS